MEQQVGGVYPVVPAYNTCIEAICLLRRADRDITQAVLVAGWQSRSTGSGAQRGIIRPGAKVRAWATNLVLSEYWRSSSSDTVSWFRG
jgi:hypothetical protein